MASGYDPKGPIFISYRRSDGHSKAVVLDNFLRSAGLVPWRDLVDLQPGETEQRVKEAFAEGISSAILLVTPQLGRSAFVPQTELPVLVELDQDAGDAQPFRLHIVNTIRSDDELDAFDTAEPARMMTDAGHWPPDPGDFPLAARAELRSFMHYALFDERHELLKLVRHLLDARLRARVDELVDKEVTIQTQTRPEADAHSRRAGTWRPTMLKEDDDDLYDLIVRLRQDSVTGVPSELSLTCLKQTLPVMVDQLHSHGVTKVELVGGGHATLLWALGAALPTTRMAEGNVSMTDPKRQLWEETPREVVADGDGGLFIPRFEVLPDSIRTAHPAHPVRAAVLLKFKGRADVGHFRKMADQLEGCVAQMIVTVDLKDLESEGPAWIPPAEGCRIARAIMDELRRFASHEGVKELHIACALPTVIAGFCGRESNTLNIVLHELGEGSKPGEREYVQTVRIECGTYGGPITEVFPQHPRKISPQDFTELVNLTPHPVNLMRDGECVQSWPAPANDAWCRVKEQGEASGLVSDRGREILVYELAEGSVENLPPARPGRGYIVPRITAAALPRSDFFFPHKQTRDEKGTVNGFEALGQLSGGPESTMHLLELLPDSMLVDDGDEG